MNIITYDDIYIIKILEFGLILPAFNKKTDDTRPIWLQWTAKKPLHVCGPCGHYRSQQELIN